MPIIVTNKTYSEMTALIAASQLDLALSYLITDRGDRGLLFRAAAPNRLENDGLRYMLCPAYYNKRTDSHGNEWIGNYDYSFGNYFYINLTLAFQAGEKVIGSNGAIGFISSDDGSSLTFKTIDGSFYDGEVITGFVSGATATLDFTTTPVSIGILAIYNAEVYKNVTGINDGIDVGVNWQKIPKSSFSNNEYIELIFNITYDFLNDWITYQCDLFSNKGGVSYMYSINHSLTYNPVDIYDWNLANFIEMTNNDCYLISNNVGATLISKNSCEEISYNKGSVILRNRIPSVISGNITTSISDCTNNGSISNNIVESIINCRNNSDITSCSGLNGMIIRIANCNNNGLISGVFDADVSDPVVDKIGTAE